MFEANRKGTQVAGCRRTIQTHSAAETWAAGEQLGNDLKGGEIVLLTGELGSGKSVFARGVAHAVGVRHWRGSPTFALVHEYASTPVLVHGDLYRLAAGEAQVLGFEEYAAPSSVLLVEWADRDLEYLETLPHTARIYVDLAYGQGDSRVLTMMRETSVEAGRDAC
jgi:tRNA threonylcarbamoyladenosine biosynthesis protein TsaE